MEADIAGRVFAGRQGQFAQQGGAGAMRVFALEAFDQIGQLRGDGARLAAVLPRLGRQRFEAAVAVAERPIQQRIDRNRGAFGIRNVVVAGGDLLGAAGEFAAGQSFEHQRGDQAVAEQGEFFGFGIHERTIRGATGLAPCKCCVGTVRRKGTRGRSAARRPSGARKRGPAQQVGAQFGKQEAVRGDPADGLAASAGPW